MNLTEKMLYLDRDFISNLYEAECGVSPETKITKTEGLRASASIPIFSAGASSVESKSYSVSTAEMCRALWGRLDKYPQLPDCAHDFGKSSSICWIEGVLSIDKVEVKRRQYTVTIIGEHKPNPDDGERLVAEEFYFAIQAGEEKVALIPTEDYFASGVGAFKELIDTVVGPIELPVRALVRVFSAQTHFKQWISVPLLMVEP